MTATATLMRPELVDPESDGKPMADNGKQFRWITLLYQGLEGVFRDDADVFVCGNQN